ncbi:MAG: hypothetical protein K1X74_04420 [Pirellulales bacterium]|nr:hypothetical protein [Pirellulales bacterium]
MSKRQHGEIESFGSDSFTDVVTNMVAILIILVLVVGMRIKQGAAVDGDPPALPADVEELKLKISALTADALRQAGEVDRLRVSIVARGQERDRLAQVAALKRRDLDARRAQLDAETRQSFDGQRALASLEQQIQQVEAELSQSQQVTRQTVKIVCYPTPISKVVEGTEGHFQLKANRIIAIPLDRLVERLKEDAREQVWKLRDRDSVTEVLGPLGGFRLRYTIVRRDLQPRAMPGGAVATGGSVVQLDEWTLIPTSGQLGETLDEALASGSEFRAALGQYDPKKTTITLWTYPDSFAEFRALKEQLHLAGYLVAGRPLPDGVPISGSPDGSKSSAQ